MKVSHRLIVQSVTVAAAAVVIALIAVDRRVAASFPAIVAADTPTDFRLKLVVIGLVALAIGSGLAYLFAHATARPIEELRDVANAMAGGDLSSRPGFHSDGEIGALAESLRLLGSQLLARRDALKAEESQVTVLTDSLHEGVVAIDARRNVVRINQTARQLLRLQAPVPFSSDQLPRDTALLEALQAVLSGAEPVPGHVTVDDRVLSLAARPLPNGGALLALYDLTPFRRLETVRRDFVANVSHELRTPLTVVRGVVETLHDADMPEDVRLHFLAMADSNVRRMQRIVDDLLDLSRIESGGWLPNPIHQDFAAVASEIVVSIEEAANAKGVVLRIDADTNATVLYADPTAVRQILSNLAENALRHTVEGEVVLFSRHEEGGIWVGVRDTGIGIDSVHLPRIFERFYRADPSRSRAEGGTGLGLAIVRHLAESHGGSVRAESTLGVGTTIQVFFPDEKSPGAPTAG